MRSQCPAVGGEDSSVSVRVIPEAPEREREREPGRKGVCVWVVWIYSVVVGAICISPCLPKSPTHRSRSRVVVTAPSSLPSTTHNNTANRANIIYNVCNNMYM